MELASALREWHDFYILGGTASATLIGLMFVAASIGAGVSDKNVAGLRLFITPTVVHFGSVLMTALAVAVPIHTWASLGALLLGGGAIGLGYAAWISIGMRRRGFHKGAALIDQLWYVLSPLAGYVAMIAAAVEILARQLAGLDVLALALVLLLLLGLRNAWDMTVWLVLRVPDRTKGG